MTCLVSGLVLAFAEDPLLERCLDALEASLARTAGPSELVIVVNRASEGARERLRSSRADAVLIYPGKNLGFAAGVSAGLARARGEWIALVNDDCVVEPDAIPELLTVGQSSEDIGSVAGQVRFARRPDAVNSAGLEVDELGVAYERLLGAQVAADECGEPAEVFGATGALALYRRTMLDEVGGFDDSFFAYLEDADLAWRARMLGWRCVYTPRAVALHHHSAALGHGSAEKHYLVGRNRVRMLAKNATSPHLRRRGAAILAYECAYVVAAMAATGTLAPLRGRLRGLREWRVYRAAGRDFRRRVGLARPAGVRGALHRNGVYRAMSARGRR